MKNIHIFSMRNFANYHNQSYDPERKVEAQNEV